ncbi:GNAT family N-acetyltransferase [Pseudarthrobacter sp. J64]|uniref:GNAT family N-acetyltransferase n=1 Tax=Pseudarthrobacter sp. J64 TaxID=3116485 RepID=UPI002E80839C|nr:GNAT family N-acetyltransferase [Pseudarthrobacter sp. J64]MEE2569234.1 GNAT family N-acetyltransferase [Pseudarthrobacter sp. J64]
MSGKASVDLELIEDLMDRAWPATVREDTGTWVLRAAGGVTQRANSVWPRREADAPADALRDAGQWYRRQRLPLIFQVFDDERSSGLNALLDEQRFTRQSETLIMVKDAAPDVPVQFDAGPEGPAVEVSSSPSEEWLRLWWEVDGRGGDAELGIARGILQGCPSVYVLVRNRDGGAAAVGRLAVPEGAGWGGLYAMATDRRHRRNGYASAVVTALLGEGRRLGLEGFWLLVTAGNPGAQALYRKFGFSERGRYLYRQAPLKRAPGGC